MTELANVHSWPDLERPLMVVSLEGWIDAGAASAASVEELLTSPAQLIATFDADELIDYRARRPILTIVNGVVSEMRWPGIRLDATTDSSGRSVLVLHGPEPDMRWHRFIEEVIALGSRLGVEEVYGLGAFPAPVPHTRPVSLVGSSTSPELVGRVGFLPSTIEVPAGVQGALEHAFGEAGVPSVGIWARVPHYVAAMPYPPAAAALLAKLSALAGLEIPVGKLSSAAEDTVVQINELIAGSPEHSSMVHQLEEQHDRELAEGDFITDASSAATGFGGSFGDRKNLPSGDEIAAELEKYLRGEG